MIYPIMTVKSGDRELDCETDVFIVREPDCWRLVIADLVDYRNSYLSLYYQRKEILLAEDYFELFTAEDFSFLLRGFDVAQKISDETLLEMLPMLMPGEQAVPEIYYDVFRDRNRDQWSRFGIIDVVKRSEAVAESMWRVEHMEPILDKLNELMQPLEKGTATAELVQEYKLFQKKVKELDVYYSSADWRADFDTDERGEFPSYLKRGVLSEDAVFDALTKNEELMATLE